MGACALLRSLQCALWAGRLSTTLLAQPSADRPGSSCLYGFCVAHFTSLVQPSAHLRVALRAFQLAHPSKAEPSAVFRWVDLTHRFCFFILRCSLLAEASRSWAERSERTRERLNENKKSQGREEKTKRERESGRAGENNNKKRERKAKTTRQIQIKTRRKKQKDSEKMINRKRKSKRKGR